MSRQIKTNKDIQKNTDGTIGLAIFVEIDKYINPHDSSLLMIKTDT